MHRRGLSEEDTEAWLDLRPFMFRSPLLVQGGASLTRALVLFRGLGLRHLLVAPQDPRSVGIITRKARAGRAAAPSQALTQCAARACLCGMDAPTAKACRCNCQHRAAPSEFPENSVQENSLRRAGPDARERAACARAAEGWQERRHHASRTRKTPHTGAGGRARAPQLLA